uniref:Uncharacterized protein n=1 Tax=Cyanophora sudae TaxID=1522369 RepID=A0A2Z4HG34_9EUKA|nr:hypothetical protein [Cyanophora sudae]AWW13702.1 hypothetical protein [Cyanophora sudae]
MFMPKLLKETFIVTNIDIFLTVDKFIDSVLSKDENSSLLLRDCYNIVILNLALFSNNKIKNENEFIGKLVFYGLLKQKLNKKYPSCQEIKTKRGLVLKGILLNPYKINVLSD